MIIFLDIAGGKGGGAEMTRAVAMPVIPNTYTAARISLCAYERANGVTGAITGGCANGMILKV